MKTPSLLRLLLLAPLLFSQARAGEAEDALLKAAAEGDAPRIVLALSEGYRITAIAGDDTPQDDKDGWLFVMTLGTALQEQTYSNPGPWPEAWIRENTAKGFRVTSSAGSGNHTIVVMSKGSGLGDQTISAEGAYPSTWIGGNW
jgi:hypothetical protein